MCASGGRVAIPAAVSFLDRWKHDLHLDDPSTTKASRIVAYHYNSQLFLRVAQPEVIRVLIVEDDIAVSAGIAALLESYAFATCVVASGRDAVPASESFRPHVVVLDVHLPDMSGDKVFCDLRSHWPQLPVIFSSGHVHDLSELVERATDRVELLRKPYQGEQLIEAIRRITR